jgi:anhydro-N-acetylmuramic acid kinase
MSLYVGLMSGTSMDAIDAVLVCHDEHPPRIVARHSHTIPEPLRHTLTTIVEGKYDGPKVWRLDVELGGLFADAVAELLRRAGVGAGDVTAIGSHGQTIYHGPEDTPPVTIQIADPNVIAERSGITTVADFRRRDLAAGGQGAPLAPAFHKAVLQSPGSARVVVNIGGIANITVLPKDPQAPVIGFDTGPGNALMDLWCGKHRGQPMDEDGRFAAQGSVAENLLAAFLTDAYFGKPPPKSTGREYFNLGWLQRFIEAAGCQADRPEDIQRTLLELTVAGIANAIAAHAPETEEVFVCGGGARNPVLMEALSNCMDGRAVSSTAKAGLDPRWIEAVAFSWMAKRTLAGEPSNLPTVTGARRAVILGAIYRV